MFLYQFVQHKNILISFLKMMLKYSIVNLRTKKLMLPI